MTTAATADAAPMVLPWLMLERLTPFDAYAQAVGTTMLVIAGLLWLCSRHTDTRALRIYALLYLLTGLGWLFTHPRAHGGAAEVPLVPALVAVGLLAMNVWGLYEFLGLARQRAWALAAGTLLVAAGMLLWLLQVSRSAFVVYGVMAAAFAYCAWLALRAARHEGNVGHLYVAAAYATYPLLLLATLALPHALAGFEIGYYAAVPGIIVGITMLAVSLIRARQRVEVELARRTAAEESLRQLNTTLEERVAARTRELRDLVDALESFNRSVSHDLRDPLAGLSGLAQLAALALQQGDTGRARRHLDTIETQLLQMSAMVQELLLLSRAREAALRRRRVDLRLCVDEALAQLRLQPGTAAALQLTRLDIGPLPACDVDVDLMRQVFANLLGNALKFSSPRGAQARVAVGLRLTGDGPVLYVQDNGLGLPEGHEDGLFKPFVRLHGTALPGSGVGLTIVRRIVEAHGGRIRAERVEGGGARFEFTLAGL